MCSIYNKDNAGPLHNAVCYKIKQLQLAMSQSDDFNLTQYTAKDQGKIVSIPLSFDCQPLEVLTKQLTKLNSNYDYRIVYLGPRWSNSTIVHKKCAESTAGRQVNNISVSMGHTLHKYSFAFDKLSKYSTFMESFQREQQSKNFIYYRAFQGMNPTLTDNVDPIFDSSFECGNLDCVVRVRSAQYDLFLRPDSNTKGYMQWYYFSIRSPSKKKVRLNICNLSRDKTLYQKVQYISE